jgi:hypothetical protein
MRQNIVKLLAICDTIKDFIFPYSKFLYITENVEKFRIKVEENTFNTIIKIIIMEYVSQSKKSFINNTNNNSINNSKNEILNYNIRNINLTNKIKNFESFFLNTELNNINDFSNLINEIIETNQLKNILLSYIVQLYKYIQIPKTNTNLNSIINENDLIIVNDSKIIDKYIRDREVMNISTSFNAMGGEYSNFTNKIQTNVKFKNIKDSFENRNKICFYSLKRKDNELLFLKEITVNIIKKSDNTYENELNIITVNGQQSIFSETDRVINSSRIRRNSQYGKPAFQHFIYNIKFQLLKGEKNFHNFINTEITSQEYLNASQTEKFRFEDKLSNDEIYSLIHSKIQRLLSFRLINEDETNKQPEPNIIQLKPMEYIYALLDIKRSMDLLQIKLCKALNDNTESKCFYMSNDQISLAFSLFYKCPTINTNKISDGPKYIYYEKKSNNSQTKSSQSGGISKLPIEILNSTLNITKTNTKVNTRLQNSLKNKNLLKEKIKVEFLKILFNDNKDFIKFLNKLPSEEINYFDFFVFHFIFTV